MANHKSTEKEIRQIEKRRLYNRYHLKTARTAVKKLRLTNDKTKAAELLPKVSSLIDKLAKRGQIHKNKAANLKSSLTKHVNSL
jgi:small subunit ribosomal protein S20